MKLIKRTLHWTGALALAGVMSASFLAPSTALAEERDSFKLAWTIYAGWMPWKYADESGIMDKWADKYVKAEAELIAKMPCAAAKAIDLPSGRNESLPPPLSSTCREVH